MKLRDVAPIGKKKSGAFVDYTDGHGAFEIREVDVFPEASVSAGRAFRDYRVHALGLSLREAARILGISVVDLSDVERGRKEFATDADREAAMLTLVGGSR